MQRGWHFAPGGLHIDSRSSEHEHDDAVVWFSVKADGRSVVTNLLVVLVVLKVLGSEEGRQRPATPGGHRAGCGPGSAARHRAGEQRHLYR